MIITQRPIGLVDMRIEMIVYGQLPHFPYLQTSVRDTTTTYPENILASTEALGRASG